MKLNFLWVLVFLVYPDFALTQSLKSYEEIGDSLYLERKYEDAAIYYVKSAESYPFRGQRKNNYYNAACCYSLLKDEEKAFKYLNLSIRNGYNDKSHMVSDSDLKFLHHGKKWKRIIRKIKPTFTGDPEKVKIVSSDIKNFYTALNLASRKPKDVEDIFIKHYFSKGSVGLDDFYYLKIRNINSFTSEIIPNYNYFNSIQPTVINNNQHISLIKASFRKFKSIYPQAVFPDVYFLIGRFTSNGTASNSGILIGTEVMSKTSITDTTSWSPYLLKWTMNYSHIPITVAHELVHFNQDKMKKENTLLRYALVEGSAEFIGELISNQTDGDYKDFVGREQEIWRDFKQDMFLDVYEEWLDSQEPKRPRGAMYWAGYLICKAYFEQATDKQQAVKDILNIQDYKTFYQMSKVDDYILQVATSP